MNHNEIFNVSDLIDIPASFWPNVSTKMRHTCSTYHNTKKNLNPLFSQTEADKKYLELKYSEPKYSESKFLELKYSEPKWYYSEPKSDFSCQTSILSIYIEHPKAKTSSRFVGKLSSAYFLSRI